MKKIKRIFSKKKQKSQGVSDSVTYLKREQSNIEVDLDTSNQGSSIVIVNEEVSLTETEKVDENWEFTISQQEESEVISLLEESANDSEEENSSNNAQKWLDKNYPKKIRSLIKELYIREKKLEGNLDLRDFINLKKLDCANNQLTGLGLSGLTQLEEVRCHNNCLVNLDYLELNPDKLLYLNIKDNNLPKQNLSVFSRFFKLIVLWIGNEDEEKIKKNNYNRFHGSLESLKYLTNLDRLNISNTDVNNGVDHLADSISRIRYSSSERLESKVKEIAEQINFFLNRGNKNDWTDIHFDFATEWKKREWKELNFGYQGTKEWIKVGLNTGDYHFAAYLRAKGYSPQQNLNWEKLREENRSAQEWVNNQYPSESRKWVTWLDISSNGLKGSLIVEDFSNLESLNCASNQLASLTINNLPKLTYLDASNNELDDLNINDCLEISRLDVRDNLLDKLDFLNSLNPSKLTRLWISNNYFPYQEITVFSKFGNLESLYLASNRFYGSLESLRNLKKLLTINTVNTEINEGFEYLPNSLKAIASVVSQDLKKDVESFKLVGWTVPTKEKGTFSRHHSVPYYDQKYWKETQPYFKWLKEELEKLNPNLNIHNILKDIFFNVRTGEFVGNLQAMTSLLHINKEIIDEKEKNINLLEIRVRELVDLIKQQKEKILQAYLHFAPELEKGMLKELIKIHLEFVKARKQKLPDIKKYRGRFNKLYEEVGDKLNEKLLQEVEIILNDCEELVTWELELEIKLNDKLLQEEKSQIPKITINSGQIKILSENIGSQLILYQKESEKSKDELKQLQQKLQLKKVQRQELLNSLQIQLTSADGKEWLKTLFEVQKKDPNLEEIDQIKGILESQGANLEQLENLLQIWKEISELREKIKIELEQTDLISQIEVIPSSSRN